MPKEHTRFISLGQYFGKWLFDSTGCLTSGAYEESIIYYPKPSWVEQNIMEDHQAEVVLAVVAKEKGA